MKLAPENLLCLENTHKELPQTIPSDKNSLSCGVSIGRYRLVCQAIMESINKKRHQELKALSGDSQQIYEFLIQMMDDKGQIGEKCFDIRCMAEKQKEQE